MGVGALGDAEVDGTDHDEADAGDDLQRGVDLAVGPVGQHALVRDEDVVEVDVVAGRAAHAERVPALDDADAVAGERDRHVQDAQAAVRVVVHEHRRQHGADGRLADERLAAADPIAALDLDGGAAGVGVVAAARGDDDDAVLGDATQGGLCSRQVPAVAPRGERGDVLVHRRREGGRAAALGQLALDGGDLADRGSVAAQLGRDGDGQEAGVADVLERFVHPACRRGRSRRRALRGPARRRRPARRTSVVGSGRRLPAGCRWWWGFR